MNEKNKKEWIKNIAIIFLAIMLLLTLFSNTIMNYSLPKVSTTYVGKGSITEQVRGTSNIETGDPFVMKAEETRKIDAVHVSKGDHVEVGDPIYDLSDVESEELSKAESDLATAELEYYKALLTTDVTAGVAASVNKNGASSFDYYVNQIGDIQTRIKACEELLDEKKQMIENLEMGKMQDAVRQTTDKLAANLEVVLATDDQTVKNNEFAKWKSETVAELEREISELNEEIKNVNTNPASELGAIKTELKAIGKGIAVSAGNTYDESTVDNATTLEALKGIYNNYLSNITETDGSIKPEYQYLNNSYNAAVQQYVAKENNRVNVSALEAQVREKQQLKSDITNLQTTDSDACRQALERLRNAEQYVKEITAQDAKVNAQYDAAVKYANEDYDRVNRELTELKAEAKNLTTDISHALDADKLSNDIQRKKDEIERLKAKSTGTQVTAPVAGTIQSVDYTAGQSIENGKDMCSIVPDGMAMTLKISVKNEEAKKVKVGEFAQLDNSWIASDAVITLTNISDDPDNPGRNSILKFSVESAELKPGQSLTVNMASVTKECDTVVPISAIHHDNSGDFVYVIETRNSPLGNKYYANKVSVNKIMNDDNYAGVTGLTSGTYIITKSDRNVEAGKQVRLNEDAE